MLLCFSSFGKFNNFPKSKGEVITSCEEFYMFVTAKTKTVGFGDFRPISFGFQCSEQIGRDS